MRGMDDIIVSLFAAATVAHTSIDVINRVEPTFAGAAESLLLAAMVGALCGVYFHQSRNGEPLIPPEGEGWRLGLSVAVRVACVGLGVMCYGYLTAVTMTALFLWKTGTIPALAPPVTGVLGCFIIPLLPAYQSGVEHAINTVSGMVSRALGGGK